MEPGRRTRWRRFWIVVMEEGVGIVPKECLVPDSAEVNRRVVVRDREGLHARPVMRFVDLASRFTARVTVRNVSLNGEPVDGKSAMQMMLLEATQGSVLEIHTRGADALPAADALSELIAKGFNHTP